MSTALRLVNVLPTEEELAQRARRRSWWLLVARLSTGRTQGDAAAALNLAAASSYGDFERGATEPSMKQLGEDVFLERLSQPFTFETEAVAGRLGTVIRLFRLINVGNWLGRLVVLVQGHYPIYLTVVKT